MKYYIPESGEALEDANEIPEWAGVDMADWIDVGLLGEYIWSHRGGWESSWPIELFLVDDEGNETKWVIDMRMEPVFSAIRMEK